MRDALLRLDGVFWSALGTIGAFVGFLFTNLKGRPLWYRRMSKHLRNERAFYAHLPRPVAEPSGEEPDLDLAETYFAAVDGGVTGVEQLTPAERRVARKDLVVLVDELQKTHETLVTALQPFATTDARAFIDEWKVAEERLATIYVGGRVISSAHTHCTLIEQLVRQLTYGPNAIQNDQLRRLGYSVVTQDRDVIIPVMKSVFARCFEEAKIIGESLRAGKVSRAIHLKEKYWFDVQRTYDRMSAALERMRNVSRQLSMA
jgi:hypothetical protein